jgi:rubrerythrin
MVCPKCGYVMADVDAECPQCARRRALDEREVQAGGRAMNCPTCGYYMTRFDVECPQCARRRAAEERLGEGRREQQEFQDKVAAVAAAAGCSTGDAADVLRQSGSVEAAIATLSRLRSVQATAPSSVGSPTLTPCEACGHTIPAQATACPQCGHPVGGHEPAGTVGAPPPRSWVDRSFGTGGSWSNGGLLACWILLCPLVALVAGIVALCLARSSL